MADTARNSSWRGISMKIIEFVFRKLGEGMPKKATQLPVVEKVVIQKFSSWRNKPGKVIILLFRKLGTGFLTKISVMCNILFISVTRDISITNSSLTLT
jgi:hypothetical protein